MVSSGLIKPKSIIFCLAFAFSFATILLASPDQVEHPADVLNLRRTIVVSCDQAFQAGNRAKASIEERRRAGEITDDEAARESKRVENAVAAFQDEDLMRKLTEELRHQKRQEEEAIWEERKHDWKFPRALSEDEDNVRKMILQSDRLDAAFVASQILEHRIQEHPRILRALLSRLQRRHADGVQDAAVDIFRLIKPSNSLLRWRLVKLLTNAYYSTTHAKDVLKALKIHEPRLAKVLLKLAITHYKVGDDDANKWAIFQAHRDSIAVTADEQWDGYLSLLLIYYSSPLHLGHAEFILSGPNVSVDLKRRMILDLPVSDINKNRFNFTLYLNATVQLLLEHPELEGTADVLATRKPAAQDFVRAVKSKWLASRDQHNADRSERKRYDKGQM